MNTKLLAPAGDMQSLKMAVFNGADEVYLGIKDFNARNIQGFDLETLKQAVQFAHVFGVKVHLAINILFDDQTLQKALDLIVDSYNLGVDAFIVQDLGLAHLVKTFYPQICLHASTQMGIHNLAGAKWAEKFGFTRVVLSRETPLEEIKRIKQNTNLEVEYFVHGALCVSFSGNCYLSSYLFDASGNQGKCKQLCRLPYDFKIGQKTLADGYLLSAKDICMIDRLDELVSAGVDSLKIEGRARRPYYVAVATRQYRNALDKKNFDMASLDLAFNRGKFVHGYFDGNGDIISNFKSHIGIYVGKVEKTNNGKRFNEIFFKTKLSLSPKSTFKIFEDGKEKSVLTAYDISKTNGYVRITTKQKINVGDEIRLIIDQQKEDYALNFVKRKPLEVDVFAIEQKPICATVKFDGKQIKVEGSICQSAQSQPLSQQEIAQNFDKSELFMCKVNAICQNAFLPKQQLNQFRRDVLAKVFDTLTAVPKPLEKTKIKTFLPVKVFENFQIVSDQNQNFEKKNIVLSPETYNINDIENFVNKCQKQNKNAYLDLPNFLLDADFEILKQIIDKTNIAVVANNVGELELGKTKVIGSGMNVYNSQSANVFDAPVMFAENSDFQISPYPYMTLRHCPFKQHSHANCKNCPYKNGYYFEMQNGKKLFVKRKKLSTCTFYLVDENK